MTVIQGYQLQPNEKGYVWTPSTTGAIANAIKNGCHYKLKIYIHYPDREGFSERSYKRALTACESTLSHLRTLHSRLRRADNGTGRLAFANEILDNKTGDDQGIIEVVPYVEGARSMDSLARKADRLKLLESLADAVVRMHSVNVRHGDLKLENALCIMHGSEPRSVLIDFDHASIDGAIPSPADIGGSDGYIPPEVMDYRNIPDSEDKELMSRLQARITDKSDIFALGMMFYRIMTNDVPGTINFAYAIDLNHPELQDNYLNELIRAMVAEEPGSRPSAEQVLQVLQEKHYSDNLTPFEEVWPEHADYSYNKVTALGRRATRIRRSTQEDVHCYAVTFEGYAPRVYSFEMMKAKGLLIGPTGTPSSERTPKTPSSVSDSAIDGYRIIGEGLSPDDQKMYKLDAALMANAGYVKICHCVDTVNDKPMYILYKEDHSYRVRSLRILELQQLIHPC